MSGKKNDSLWRTFVTKRRKLFETSGKLNASLCELSSLTRPSPTPTLTLAGNFGKLAGKRLESKRSETLVESDAEVGTLTPNLRVAVDDVGRGKEGGKDVDVSGLRDMGIC